MGDRRCPFHFPSHAPEIMMTIPQRSTCPSNSRSTDAQPCGHRWGNLPHLPKWGRGLAVPVSGRSPRPPQGSRVPYGSFDYRRIEFSDTSRLQDSMADTDAELIQALRAGQTAALGTLYDRYSSLVFGIAVKMLNNATEAEDLTQEIFLTLWQHQAYQTSRGTLGSYLSTLTRSRAIDRLRVGSNRRRILDQWSGEVSPSTTHQTPFDHVSSKERGELVRQAMTELPEMHRRVLELSYFEGLSQSEIAQRIDAPLGTVKTWARKGLLQLSQHLKFLQDE